MTELEKAALAPAAVCCVLKRIFDLRKAVKDGEFDEKTVPKLQKFLERVSFEEEITSGDFERCWGGLVSLAKNQMDAKEENEILRAAVRGQRDVIYDAREIFAGTARAPSLIRVMDEFLAMPINKTRLLEVEILVEGGVVQNVDVPRGVKVRVTDLDEKEAGGENFVGEYINPKDR